jgi:hypothetical protein
MWLPIAPVQGKRHNRNITRMAHSLEMSLKLSLKLTPAQYKCVYLGNISLTCAYFLDFKVRIVHMLLMSWGSEQVEDGSTGWEVDAETTRKILLGY